MEFQDYLIKLSLTPFSFCGGGVLWRWRRMVSITAVLSKAGSQVSVL